MYKTVSIQNSTYQNLNQIAQRLNKPKARVIDDLIKDRLEVMSEQDKKKTKEFDEKMDKLTGSLKLSKKIKIDTNDIDQYFEALADTDFGREK